LPEQGIWNGMGLELMIKLIDFAYGLFSGSSHFPIVTQQTDAAPLFKCDF